jgi:hypothetical protein
VSTIKVDTYLTRGGASEIAIDKLKGASSASSISVVGEGGTTTTNLQQGLAKAWVHRAEHVSVDSLNLASLTDNATGQCWFNTTAAFSSKDTLAHSGATQPSADWNDTISWTTSSSTQVKTYTGSDSTLIDLNPVGSIIHGDLA